MKKFNIASCQMNVVDDKEINVNHAIELINEASNNADLITLPEMFNTPYDNDKFIENAEEEKNSYTLKAMCETAKENNIFLQSGSIAELENEFSILMDAEDIIDLSSYSKLKLCFNF